MSSLRVLPVRQSMLGSVLLVCASLLACVTLLGQAFGRRADVQGGVLPAALRLAAMEESLRLQSSLDQHEREMDAALLAMLHSTQGPAPDAAPLAALGKLCGLVTFPSGVVRAGVVDGESGQLIAWVDVTEKGCVDRLWSLQAQALTGPPFPSPQEVQRLAQAAMFGMPHVVDGKTAVVGVHREGVFVHLRYARGGDGKAAFVDFLPSDLPTAPTVGGVRMDSFVTVGGVVAGYVHGGPGTGMVPAAVKRIKAGENRALELPDVAEAAASRAVLAWLFPSESDDDDLALAAHQVTLDAAVPQTVELVTLASCAWPTATTRTRLLVALLMTLTAVAHLLMLVLVNRKLSRALWTHAQQVRHAWMLSHEDDHSPDDDERAQRLVDAMANGSQETLHAAFGKTARFWSAGPLQRLLAVIRGKWLRKP